MLNIEGKSAEAKIGKILILVSVMLGVLIIILLMVLITFIRPTGELTGFGLVMIIPLWILISILTLKMLGVILGILALYYTEKNEFSTAGILAAVSSVLPPLDLIMLIGGIFCLISKEANEIRTPPPL